ncbi:MAG: TetR/AcrR family transcriptional regulator [Lactovum sp.]
MSYYTQSDERIFDSFCLLANQAESYHKISMKQVAEKMHISRQTLNNHGYSNIEDIVKHLHIFVNMEAKKEIEAFISKNSDNDNLDLMLLFVETLLPNFYKQRYYFYTIYRHTSGPYWLKTFEDSYIPLIKPFFRNLEEADLSAKLFIQFIDRILSSWLTKERPENPIDFQEKFLSLISCLIDTLIHL